MTDPGVHHDLPAFYGDCHLQPDGPTYTPRQIAACIERLGLLTLTITLPELPWRDARVSAGDASSVESEARRGLSREQMAHLLRQAVAAGCQEVTFEDRPEWAWPDRLVLIDEARTLGMTVQWATLGWDLDGAIARELARRGVTVLLRMDALEADLQNQLVGHDDAHALVHAALEALLAVHDDDARPPAVSVGVCQANLAGVPDLWRWLRQRGARPRLQIITPHDQDRPGRGGRVTPQAWQSLVHTLRQMDQTQFGVTWPDGAATGRGSWQPVVGLHVDGPTGEVRACPGIDIVLSSLHRESLYDVLQQSEVLENLRMYAGKLKPPCRQCATDRGCLCSRSAAWQATGDYLGTDPYCPHAQGSPSQGLPAPAWPWIPHGPSMRAIDTLMAVGERQAWTRWVVPADSPLIDDQGLLDETAYIEMVAQSFAASHGFHMTDEERARHRGLLLGVKDMVVHDQARVGDTLEVRIVKISRFGQFGVIEGSVRHTDSRLIAHLEVKIWRPGPDDHAILPT